MQNQCEENHVQGELFEEELKKVLKSTDLAGWH